MPNMSTPRRWAPIVSATSSAVQGVAVVEGGARAQRELPGAAIIVMRPGGEQARFDAPVAPAAERFEDQGAQGEDGGVVGDAPERQELHALERQRQHHAAMIPPARLAPTAAAAPGLMHEGLS